MYGGIEGGMLGSSSTSGPFNESSVRRGFVRKVYCILTVQLAVTLGIMGIFFINEVRLYAIQNGWLFWLAFGLSFACLITLACCNEFRRKVPFNYIALSIFTLMEGLLLGTASVFYTADEVLLAVGICAIVVLGLSIFAIQTKIDFTMATGIMFVACLCLLIFGIFAAIFHDRILNIVYASLGALIFSVYIVIDTQLMLGGNHKYELDPEEYIFAALNLYLDIVQLFLMILTLIGNSRS